MMKKKVIVPVVVMVLVTIIGVFSVKVVPTGYTGVRTTFGQVDSNPVFNGINWKIPFVQSISLVNNKQQDIEFYSKVWSETNERTAIYYEGVVVTYQINPEMSAWIYANVSNYQSALVSENIVASAIKASSKQLSDTDATNRGLIEPLIQTNLQNSLDEKYQKDTIIINKVTVSNIDFDESYNLAIANKQKAMIEAQTQEIENQKAIAKAEADAKVKLTQAQAEADANKIIEQSLSNEILKEMYIEKWNGQLPQVVSDGSVLISLND